MSRFLLYDEYSSGDSNDIPNDIPPTRISKDDAVEEIRKRHNLSYDDALDYFIVSNWAWEER